MDPVGENPSKHWKFKNDLLKTKADIASQIRENLQTFVWWGRSGSDSQHENSNLRERNDSVKSAYS